MNIKGILINCSTNEEREVELKYKIRFVKTWNERFLTIMDDKVPLGFENLHFEDKSTNIEEIKKFGWFVYPGSRWNDKIFIPPEELKKVFDNLKNKGI